jgi:coproporphyrinogen III oxidase-like Fe-S oxidoreductase
VPAAWLTERVAGEAALARRIQDWTRAGRLTLDDGRARLTEAGFLLSDSLFVDLL